MKTSTFLYPNLRIGEFEVEETGDTYFDMSNYKKGYVWVNDRLLGRYWSIGPQQRLYCPGVWLKKGKNIIHILELLDDRLGIVQGFQDILG